MRRTRRASLLPTSEFESRPVRARAAAACRLIRRDDLRGAQLPRRRLLRCSSIERSSLSSAAHLHRLMTAGGHELSGISSWSCCGPTPLSSPCKVGLATRPAGPALVLCAPFRPEAYLAYKLLPTLEKQWLRTNATYRVARLTNSPSRRRGEGKLHRRSSKLGWSGCEGAMRRRVGNLGKRIRRRRSRDAEEGPRPAARNPSADRRRTQGRLAAADRNAERRESTNRLTPARRLEWGRIRLRSGQRRGFGPAS